MFPPRQLLQYSQPFYSTLSVPPLPILSDCSPIPHSSYYPTNRPTLNQFSSPNDSFSSPLHFSTSITSFTTLLDTPLSIHPITHLFSNHPSYHSSSYSCYHSSYHSSYQSSYNSANHAFSPPPIPTSAFPRGLLFKPVIKYQHDQFISLRVQTGLFILEIIDIMEGRPEAVVAGAFYQRDPPTLDAAHTQGPHFGIELRG